MSLDRSMLKDLVKEDYIDINRIGKDGEKISYRELESDLYVLTVNVYYEDKKDIIDIDREFKTPELYRVFFRDLDYSIWKYEHSIEDWIEVNQILDIPYYFVSNKELSDSGLLENKLVSKIMDKVEDMLEVIGENARDKGNLSQYGYFSAIISLLNNKPSLKLYMSGIDSIDDEDIIGSIFFNHKYTNLIVLSGKQGKRSDTLRMIGINNWIYKRLKPGWLDSKDDNFYIDKGAIILLKALLSKTTKESVIYDKYIDISLYDKKEIRKSIAIVKMLIDKLYSKGVEKPDDYVEIILNYFEPINYSGSFKGEYMSIIQMLTDCLIYDIDTLDVDDLSRMVGYENTSAHIMSLSTQLLLSSSFSFKRSVSKEMDKFGDLKLFHKIALRGSTLPYIEEIMKIMDVSDDLEYMKTKIEEDLKIELSDEEYESLKYLLANRIDSDKFLSLNDEITIAKSFISENRKSNEEDDLLRKMKEMS